MRAAVVVSGFRRTRSVSFAGAVLAVLALLGTWSTATVTAADDWIEVKSAHFTIVSNASERTTRRLVWQFEQVRSATSAIFSWAKTDLNRPLHIIIVKDENSMRALAPEYWENRRAGRPASVWVGGPDGTYIALRGDVEVEDRGTLNRTGPRIGRTSTWCSIRVSATTCRYGSVAASPKS